MIEYILCGGMILIIIAIVCYCSPSPVPRGKCDNCRFRTKNVRQSDKQHCSSHLTEYQPIEEMGAAVLIGIGMVKSET